MANLVARVHARRCRKSRLASRCGQRACFHGGTPTVPITPQGARRACLLVISFACLGGCATPTHPASEPLAASSSGSARPSAAAASTGPSLRVGTSGDYAPFSTLKGTAPPSGFDAELALLLAHDLGLEIQWVKFRWPELATRVAEDAFDVAMGGVTWQPERAVTGYLTRSVAHGGPCVIGATDARRLGVNHGGVLEVWARRTFPGRELLIVDDNRSLPGLLATGQIQAIVTDTFERRAFARPIDPVHCEPPLSQKIYWITPAHRDLGPTIDAWLRDRTPRIREAQQRWFGEAQRLDATTHLVDLLARRFAFMPLVAAQKKARGLPIEDPQREREVLEAVQQKARGLGLPLRETTELFQLQIELSKVVQQRPSEPTTLDLGTQIRPTLSALGDRILDALVEARAAHATPTEADLEPLSTWLTPTERQQLLSALKATAAPGQGS